MTPAATTGRLIPQARPSAALLSTKQQGMFLSSHCAGSVITTSRGSQSAARITASTSLLVIDLSSSLTPLRTCRRGSSCCSSSRIFLVSLGSAMGSGLRIFSTITVLFSFSVAPTMSMNSSCSTFSSISFNYITHSPSLIHKYNTTECSAQLSETQNYNFGMTSIDLYDQLVKNMDTTLLASERESRQSLREAATDEFQVLVRQIRQLLEEVGENNRDILRLKDKLAVNARQEKETDLCLSIKKTCDANYLLLTEVRQKLQAATAIVERERTESPGEPETFSKLYRKQHLSEEVDRVLGESFAIQKLVERFSVETNLKRIRLVLPDISQKEAEKMAKDQRGLEKAMVTKITGKASLALKYAHEDILSKARGIAQLEASVEENLKLMKEVSLLVHQQGQIIDDILKNVTEAKDYTAKAVVVLEKEKEKHKTVRKKMCCIIFIGLLVLGLILTPIIITIVKRNSSSSSDTPTNDTTTNDTNTTTVNSTIQTYYLPFPPLD